MSGDVTVFKRCKREAYVGIWLCILIAGGGIVLAVACNNSRELRDYLPFILLGGAVLLLVFLIALVKTIAVLSDTGPKLSIDAHSLTDYRSDGGPRQIAWGDIRSMDSDIFVVNGSVTAAQLILYVISGTRSVETVRVSLAGLDCGPMQVQQSIKEAWIEFTLQEERPE